MFKNKIIAMSALFAVMFGFSAEASICYLSSGECSEDVKKTDLSRCSFAQGYYSAESLPVGYDCVKVTDGCVGLYKCEKNRCLKAGYTLVEADAGFGSDAWICDKCEEKGVTYRRCMPKPCEAGYSTEVTAKNCTAGKFYKSHNSGNYVCGKCVEATENTCAKGVAQIPEGCYTCKINGLHDLNGKACFDCTEMKGFLPYQPNNDCVKAWQKATAADGSVCYKVSAYKTREEAGCHANYNAAKCECGGAADGCPDGYFASVKSCPAGYSFVSENGCGTCMTVGNCKSENVATGDYLNKSGAENVVKISLRKNNYNNNANGSKFKNYNGDECKEICKKLDDKGSSFCVISCDAPYFTTVTEIGRGAHKTKCEQPRNIYLHKPANFKNG